MEAPGVDVKDETCSISFHKMLLLMYQEGGPNKMFLLTTLSWAVLSLLMMGCISNTGFFNLSQPRHYCHRAVPC